MLVICWIMIVEVYERIAENMYCDLRKLYEIVSKMAVEIPELHQYSSEVC